MQSEFYHVALDRLRYSLVWEDSDSLLSGLDIQPDDRVLVITSAGCNVLNTMLKNPSQVVAIDINPVQNALLRLKMHLIRFHEYAVFRALMGFDGPARVGETFAQVAPTLPADIRAYWTSFFAAHPGGILPAGKLEAYLTGFLATLDLPVQACFRQLTQFESVAEQRNFFMNELHRSSFRAAFVQYFSDAGLGQGRDPKLFRYAQEPGGTAFYNRLLGQLSTTLVKNNFFFRFFFFGPQHLPENILPPCYRPENYAALGAATDRLTVVEGEAVAYLLSDAGGLVNKASLSNIFEYTSEADFRNVCRLLRGQSHPGLRFVFWNLLQDQGTFLRQDGWTELPRPDSSSLAAACFYFKNQRVAEANPLWVPALPDDFTNPL